MSTLSKDRAEERSCGFVCGFEAIDFKERKTIAPRRAFIKGIVKKRGGRYPEGVALLRNECVFEGGYPKRMGGGQENVVCECVRLAGVQLLGGVTS
jgi:hypothetical protein